MTLINDTMVSQEARQDQAIAPAGSAKNLRHAQLSSIADNGKVRLGAQGPAFRRATATVDTGKVRIGAQRMVF